MSEAPRKPKTDQQKTFGLFTCSGLESRLDDSLTLPGKVASRHVWVQIHLHLDEQPQMLREKEEGMMACDRKQKKMLW